MLLVSIPIYFNNVFTNIILFVSAARGFLDNFILYPSSEFLNRGQIRFAVAIEAGLPRKEDNDLFMDVGE